MKHRWFLAAVIALTLASLVTLALAQSRRKAQDDSGRKLHALLSGTAEVPGPGDSDGIGEAWITVTPGQRRITYSLRVTGVTASEAHIHRGAAGVAGPVEVTLGTPDASGMSSGSVTVTRDLALQMLRTPERYYVNVHSSEFSSGAIRGQLELGGSAAGSPDTTGMQRGRDTTRTRRDTTGTMRDTTDTLRDTTPNLPDTSSLRDTSGTR